MIRQLRAAIIVLLLFALVPAPCFSGSEPWADQNLKDRDGLILWLDASTLNRSREALGLPPVPASGPVDYWPDGSGSKTLFGQRLAESRPAYLALDTGQAVVRFDGKDDALAAHSQGRKLGQFTLFLVASPRSNPGLFRSFFATNAIGRNDYQSGFNVDLGPSGSSRFETLNVEGIGFGGALNLIKEARPFGEFQCIETIANDSSVTISINGKEQGQRDRKAEPISVDEMTLGARFYSNEPTPPSVNSFLSCDIAELLLYDRALNKREALSVRSYLEKKHEGLDARVAKLEDPRIRPLKTVANPPRVQMFVPGFTVDELPIKLPNINNLRYRHDGKLFALGYNGDVSILTDTDGDGVEDQATKFWEANGRLRGPIGMALTPLGYQLGSGAFVASKGKVSLLLDTNGDDKADKEIIVAEGWPELPVAVDALGVAVAEDGSIFFGLGTADYTNAYQVDDKGHANYRLDRERGAIIKVSPDFKTREIVSTGIRFPVALAFNARGDLFATDQEGATWLPNGNPFDELLHIQSKRHYGFPPRHPKHLPDVIDEPSTFDYSPQHQSTCGLTFDEPTKPQGPIFGPDWWRGDALVCGYSRGKLYRTKLVPTDLGYVAHNDLIACLDKLIVDSALAPDGSLAVACHSGGPDWGSGPNGEGTLYKIKLTDKNRPQPVLSWSESSTETRIAFDRPLELADLTGIAENTSIEHGRAVMAGDRFETLRPGYAVVAGQLAAPRLRLAVRGVAVSPDRRTLMIATEADHQTDSHAITIPDSSRSKTKGLRQSPQIDLGYDLSGARATWIDETGKVLFAGWVPHIDPTISRVLVTKSGGHEAFLKPNSGELTLTAKLNLHDLLRPAVQPGATVDAILPRERVTLRLEASGAFSVRAGTLSAVSRNGEAIEIALGEVNELVPITITLKTKSNTLPRLVVSTKTSDDSRARPLPLRRVLVPWAESSEASASESLPALPQDIQSADWSRGKSIFMGETGKCFKCHSIGGKGALIGPDLGNLPQRDFASVLRDIREPSFAIHPDFIAQVVGLKDGRVLTGIVRDAGKMLSIGDLNGQITTVVKAEVEEMKPSTISTMPTGLLDALGPEKTRDLLKFLLTPALEPAPIRREGAPPPRTTAEVDAVLRGLPASDPKKWKSELKVLLVAGPKDHGIDEHDYPLWKERWAKLLAMGEGISVRTAEVWPSDADLAWADVAVWFSANPGWTADRGKTLDAFLARGGGLVYLHWAINGQGAPEELASRIGLASKPGFSKFRHGPLTLETKPEHPIMAAIKSPSFEDESYWDLVGDVNKCEVLATSKEEGKDRPMIWVYEQGKGRVVGCILGHYSWTFDDPFFRAIVLRAIAWSAHEPTDRLQGLVKVGARISTSP
jgi:putative heme-binding domain-containing protein